MSALMLDEISMEDPLCDSSFGSMVTLDYVTPDTSFDTSFGVDVPCGILCNLSSRTCDRVAGLS